MKASDAVLVLATTSATRIGMLRRAGVTFETGAPTCDEAALKAEFRSNGENAEDLALQLASAKAASVSLVRPADCIIGADQILHCDGIWFDKPRNICEAKSQLRQLSGRTHELITAIAGARGGSVIWRHCETARMTMRTVSQTFVDTYVETEGTAILNSVGAYLVESKGSQLFERIDGSYFSVLGLPLLPLLGFLRQVGELAS